MYTLTATNKPECEQFLKIRLSDGEFQTIDCFIKDHPDVTEDFLNSCTLNYRGRELTYKDYEDKYTAFSEKMEFVSFRKPHIILEDSVRAAAYFTKKAIECLQFARFFTMKSSLLLDTDYNIHWSQGYVPQFLFRCIYFGTSTTWFSNAFDQVLQSVYWAKKLYTSATARNAQPYDDTWDAKKIMENCTYEFVVGALKARGLTDCRKHLTTCSSKIEEVRKWAHYIKHKGGIDYKYLEAEAPFAMYFVPVEEDRNAGSLQSIPRVLPDEKYRIKDFKSPVEIDIDEKLQSLVEAHAAVFQCINETIADIDYENYSVKMGGAQ
ncbi:MAG: hypothetical protein IKI49_02230 [Oscillospiraceae bacterium]|nr:hypothetical protein [Oscillospiraceae bacterium]